MKTSTARGGIAKMISRRSSATSTATGPRRRRSWPTPCGSSCRAPPLSSTMPSARIRCPTRHWPPCHRAPHALQSRDAAHTVQGPETPPPAHVLSGQSALVPCHGPALRHPRPRVEHVLLLHPL